MSRNSFKRVIKKNKLYLQFTHSLRLFIPNEQILIVDLKSVVMKFEPRTSGVWSDHPAVCATTIVWETIFSFWQLFAIVNFSNRKLYIAIHCDQLQTIFRKQTSFFSSAQATLCSSKNSTWEPWSSGYGGDSRSKGRGFESQHWILDGQDIFHFDLF